MCAGVAACVDHDRCRALAGRALDLSPQSWTPLCTEARPLHPSNPSNVARCLPTPLPSPSPLPPHPAASAPSCLPQPRCIPPPRCLSTDARSPTCTRSGVSAARAPRDPSSPSPTSRPRPVSTRVRVRGGPPVIPQHQVYGRLSTPFRSCTGQQHRLRAAHPSPKARCHRRPSNHRRNPSPKAPSHPGTRAPPRPQARAPPRPQALNHPTSRPPNFPTTQLPDHPSARHHTPAAPGSCPTAATGSCAGRAARGRCGVDHGRGRHRHRQCHTRVTHTHTNTVIHTQSYMSLGRKFTKGNAVRNGGGVETRAAAP